MKKRSLAVVVFTSLLAVAPLAAGVDEWTQVGKAGRIVNLEIAPGAPSILFAVDPGAGLYRRIQGQGSRLSFRLTPGEITPGGLAVDPVTPSTVYLGLSEKIARSIDSGLTWTVHSGLTCTWVTWIEIDPRLPSTLYAGGHQPARSCGSPPTLCLAWKSTDSGRTWSCLREGRRQWIPGGGWGGYFLYPQAELAVAPRGSSLFAFLDGVLYRSTDGGVHWPEVGRVDLPAYDLEVDPGNPSVLYLGRGDGLLRSTDGGRTWTFLRRSHPRQRYVPVSLAIDPTRTTTLYAAKWNGEVSKNRDSGRTWTLLPRIPAERGVVSDIEIDPSDPSTLYVATEQGVMALTQSGRR